MMTAWHVTKKAWSLNLNISSSRHNINKLMQHKICTINLSSLKSKNMLSSKKTQGEKSKKVITQPLDKKKTKKICEVIEYSSL